MIALVLASDLPDVLTDQIGTVYSLMFSFFKKAKAAIDFCDDTRDGGLACGPRRSGEHQVVGALSHFESAVLFADQFHVATALTEAARPDP